jgi:oligopeptide transport system ATP-binding protein
VGVGILPKKLLEIKNLKTSFFTGRGEVRAVRGIDFEIEKGEAVGIVGESGSGKTATALSIMRLIDKPGRIIDGEILFNKKNLMDKSEKEMMDVRGGKIAMIFQDPSTSLNPVFTIGNQIIETVMKHKNLSKKEARERAAKALLEVGILHPYSRMSQYPHEFSGGMKQRAMIAMALCCEPDLIIADEATSSLDATVQAQILQLMNEIRKENEMSMLVITHDLGVIAELCSRVVVMYGGLIMESGKATDVLKKPMHPYTRGLLKSIPGLNTVSNNRLYAIEGSPPDMYNNSVGCPFAPRCPYAMKICKVEKPEYYETESGSKSMCWLLDKDAPSSVKGTFLKGAGND